MHRVGHGAPRIGLPQVVVKKYGYLTRFTPVQMRHGGIAWRAAAAERYLGPHVDHPRSSSFLADHRCSDSLLIIAVLAIRAESAHLIPTHPDPS
jgi:hypothetical protein